MLFLESITNNEIRSLKKINIDKGDEVFLKLIIKTEDSAQIDNIVKAVSRKYDARMVSERTHDGSEITLIFPQTIKVEPFIRDINFGPIRKNIVDMFLTVWIAKDRKFIRTTEFK